MTIPVWLAIGFMSLPCQSNAATVGHETVIHQCPAPELQGPPPVPPKMNIPQPIVKKKAVVKKKRKYRRKKRHG